MSNITTSILTFTLGLALSIGIMHIMFPVHADDSAAIYSDQCADCHELVDFEGATNQELTEYLLGVLSGAERHPPIELTAEEATRMAEFIAPR